MSARSAGWGREERPERAAALLAADRPPEWIDRFAEELDRMRGGHELERVLAVWGLSQAEAGRVFGVSRQAIAKWVTGGVPSERAVAVADLAAATDLLVRYLRRDRIPAVVRRASAISGGRSLLDLARDDPAAALTAVRSMFDFALAHA